MKVFSVSTVFLILGQILGSQVSWAQDNTVCATSYQCESGRVISCKLNGYNFQPKCTSGSGDGGWVQCYFVNSSGFIQPEQRQDISCTDPVRKSEDRFSGTRCSCESGSFGPNDLVLVAYVYVEGELVRKSQLGHVSAENGKSAGQNCQDFSKSYIDCR